MDILKNTCVPKTNGKKVDNDVLELHAEYYGNQKASVNAPHSEMVNLSWARRRQGLTCGKKWGRFSHTALKRELNTIATWRLQKISK